MSNPERDTHFAGWAKALLTKIDTAIGTGYERIAHEELSEQEFANELGTMIARAGYDLVEHTLDKTLDLVGNWSSPIEIMMEEDFVERIPDLPTLPEEETK